MFAARRNLRVMGRTEILVVSMITRKGFSQAGAPPGRREAAHDEGLAINPDRMRDSHSGSPITSVNDK